MRCINFAPVSKQTAFDYKILASYLLSKSILEFFDVTTLMKTIQALLKRQVMSVSFFTSILTRRTLVKKSGMTLSLMVSQKAVRLMTFLP